MNMVPPRPPPGSPGWRTPPVCGVLRAVERRMHRVPPPGGRVPHPLQGQAPAAAPPHPSTPTPVSSAPYSYCASPLPLPLPPRSPQRAATAPPPPQMRSPSSPISPQVNACPAPLPPSPQPPPPPSPPRVTAHAPALCPLGFAGRGGCRRVKPPSYLGQRRRRPRPSPHGLRCARFLGRGGGAEVGLGFRV